MLARESRGIHPDAVVRLAPHPAPDVAPRFPRADPRRTRLPRLRLVGVGPDFLHFGRLATVDPVDLRDLGVLLGGPPFVPWGRAPRQQVMDRKMVPPSAQGGPVHPVPRFWKTVNRSNPRFPPPWTGAFALAGVRHRVHSLLLPALDLRNRGLRPTFQHRKRLKAADRTLRRAVAARRRRDPWTIGRPGAGRLRPEPRQGGAVEPIHRGLVRGLRLPQPWPLSGVEPRPGLVLKCAGSGPPANVRLQ